MDIVIVETMETVEIYGNCGNLWRSRVPQLKCGNLWKSMEIYGTTDWHLATYGDLWGSVAGPQSTGYSAFACKHSWSIEGWIHSKKRNRLGQSLVECLVRTHTNLLLESKLDLWLAKVMTWEKDMVIAEPEEEVEEVYSLVYH